jgi:hypothetical protein
MIYIESLHYTTHVHNCLLSKGINLCTLYTIFYLWPRSIVVKIIDLLLIWFDTILLITSNTELVKHNYVSNCQYIAKIG